MTPFGKEVRKLRIDREMLLGDMAARLGMTSSYLSQIEMGKKAIPRDLAGRISDILRLDRSEIEALSRSVVLSTKSITLTVHNPDDRELVNTFVTELARLTPDQKIAIERVIKKG